MHKKTLKSFVSILDFKIFYLGLVKLVKTTVAIISNIFVDIFIIFFHDIVDIVAFFRVTEKIYQAFVQGREKIKIMSRIHDFVHNNLKNKKGTKITT
jgi:hypothetical protein